MSKGKEAVALHAKGFNCAQCVLKSSKMIGQKTAEKIACGFGGGLRSGEVCGAASGAVMVIGLKGGEAAEVKKFMSEFREHFGTVRCLELKAKKISCDELIEYAADAVDNVEV